MKSICAPALFLALAAFNLSAADYKPQRSGFDFPIYTNQPSGNMLENDPVRRAASSPALAPEETRKLIQVPSGFDVRLFAAEPMVVNPVAMTWDERGRLWVVELYEYPKGAPKGQKGRDRIKILEDSDADGVADKVTVFADGFSLATGIALGNGGVYLGQAPDLLFLQDTDGDDKADKITKVLTGFGMEDRHELLNGFAWGPDGWLYMTHGVFTHSKVRDPDAHDPDGFGVQMDAALARFHPMTKKFEVFADGTSNPWGVDWNERGDAFVSACVIQHLFHMAPGGQYNRQGGTWANPYGYVGDLPSKGLPAIVDFRHYRAAHAGICVYQGDQWPAEWRGLVFLGNIHQNALNVDRLTRLGATYTAEKESTLLAPAGEAIRKKSGERIAQGEEWKHVGPGNFMVSRDPWVRPVSNQTGPDGAMWVMDWYDKYPCYQNAQADPEGVDREYGRIWRVVWVGDQPGKAVPSRPGKGMDLKKLGSNQLVQLTESPNSWQRRQAQQIIRERSNRDVAAAGANEKQLAAVTDAKASRLESRLASMWSLQVDPTSEQLTQWATDPQPEIRHWAARILGAASNAKLDGRKVLAALVADSDVTVRGAAAVALRQMSSGSLTVNTQPGLAGNTREFLPYYKELLARPSVAGDTYYPHIVWMAMEPRVAADPTPFFPLLAANDNSVSAYATHRVMRRICDLTNAVDRARHLDAALVWLAGNAGKTHIAAAALNGLIEASKSKSARPTIDTEPIFARLSAQPALAEKAQRLAAAYGDKGAVRQLLAKINDSSAAPEERSKGINAARDAKTPAAQEALLKLIKSGNGTPPELKSEAVRALAGFGPDQAVAIIAAWPQLPPMTRRGAVDALVRSPQSARTLLAAVEKKTISPNDISATARRALATSDDKSVVQTADRALGKYRQPGADKLQLIAEKRAVVLSGTADVKNGHAVAQRNCFVCHKMYGEGADVGPDLTGVGRSSLDALLHNVIDPNEVIGNGYETTEVETKDGTTYTGRVTEETGTRIKLVNAGPVEYVVAKSDIALEKGQPKVVKKELSLMPEGLEQIPDNDFRDLMIYLLNPPGDNRAWSQELRRELLGASSPATSAQR